ncbi:lamin tail domain-containing protein [Lacipirellula sp.]|uniref:lamin tail domain-containing protein n=1 Tax=Lacipirellula sp. TaxID=2691419 RepID=UPI003D108394
MKHPLALAFATACLLAFGAVRASAAISITEWAYQGGGGEFVEFTNLGAAAVDMTGWSFDDNTGVAGSLSLSGFGIVAPGESVILTDLTAAAFRTEWNLAPTVKVVGENTQNLGRADEINLYDSSNVRIDWLTYDDQTLGSPRTNNASANPLTLAAVGAHNSTLWKLSVAGDSYGSVTSVNGGIGNPGKFTLVPEPASAAVLVSALLGFGVVRRRVR